MVPKKDKALEREADIYVINPEGLDWLLKTDKTKNKNGKTKVKVNVKEFKKLGFDTLIVDELSKFKHTNTNRFKAIKHILPTFGRRWGLTGSPVPNGLMDLFGQAYILDMGNALGTVHITHYRGEYFVSDFMGYEWTLMEGAEKKIYKALEPLVLRMSAEDYLDMPEKIDNNIVVDLPKKVYDIYDELEEELIVKINEGTVVASNAASVSTKCRQIVNGSIYMDPDVRALLQKPKEKREWVTLHSAKVDALADLVEELQGSPLLVAYDFKHDLAALQKKFGKDVPYIGGGTSIKRSTQLERQWNKGELPILLGHPQAIGHGLNLQGAGHHICWFSLTWNYELYDQFIRRVYRQGNTNEHVFVHHLIARGTIDQVILRVLQSKARDQQALFNALKKLKKERGNDERSN